MSERKAFKDYFDRATARTLAAQVRRVHTTFDETTFVRHACRGLGRLELSGRVQQFSDALAVTLPSAVPKALEVLTESLPDPLPGAQEIADGWHLWPIGQFIADHGLPHFDASMVAMIALTKRFSSEFAVRPFVEKRPEETFERLYALTGDPNPHVRRWCSEGVRPRLPWGKKLTALVADPSPIWPILEELKDDPELYVRRSVANNVNDVAKDHAAAVVKRCKAWTRGASDDRRWLIKHALRTLIKDGDRGALAVVGYGPPKKLTAALTVSPNEIAIGGDVLLRAELATSSARPQELLVDFVVHYVRKRGVTSGKVFKWKTLALEARGARAIEKRHRMRPTSIRALYPGEHRVELQVNGVRVAETRFRLHASI